MASTCCNLAPRWPAAAVPPPAPLASPLVVILFKRLPRSAPGQLQLAWLQKQ